MDTRTLRAAPGLPQVLVKDTCELGVVMRPTRPESGEGALGLSAPTRGRTVWGSPGRRPKEGYPAASAAAAAIQAGAGPQRSRQVPGLHHSTRGSVVGQDGHIGGPMAIPRLPVPVQSAPVAGPHLVFQPMGKFAVGWGGAENRVAG